MCICQSTWVHEIHSHNTCACYTCKRTLYPNITCTAFFSAHLSLGDPLHITILTNEIAEFHMLHSDYWARVYFSNSKDGHVDDVGNEGGDDERVGVDGILETLN